ncbi:CHAT domain-containing protein [Nostoc sp. CHAB 5836]|uniref:nSTAND1 domain-containing NTPase n=1 Tax=Nostoc sp. CHAB 5836 TaxID=2780404 RepID=UPI001E5B80E4|nr:CHAT domain-containing protein [Nostoc sp. CHAB 5836]MCC5615269.1 CHAT domain-containing protein [Nostoc sp. CHAB 5836]
MEVWVNLQFGDGDFEQGFSKIKLQINAFSTQSDTTQLETQLPPAEEIPNSYERWKKTYNLLVQSDSRGFKSNQVTNVSADICSEYAKSLREKLNQWLLPIKLQLEPAITSNTNIDIRLIVNTHGVTSEPTKNILHRIPWQECYLFDQHSSSEVALSFKDYLQKTAVSTNKLKSEIFRRIKIISIFGDSKNLDTETDEKLIIQLEKQGAEIISLKEPKRESLQKLWDEPCDILFFAGHSESQEDGKKGVIALNPNDSLDLEEIPNTLKSAISKGLKLAIFNSCDGLGLAQRLADLNLPYVIVWREPVPDKIAHKFLKFFLYSYAGGDSLFTAVLKARGKLQELTEKSEGEKPLPGVSWLPIICKNTLELPPSWSDLGGLSGKLPECPYQGLSAFGEEEADFFFGREKFVDQLVAAVQSKSLVPVVGASGSGKSSVVFAGLVPNLRKVGNVEIISFRPGNNPLGNLAIALNHHCHSPAPLQEENSTDIQRRLDQMVLEVDLRDDETKLCDAIASIDQNLTPLPPFPSREGGSKSSPPLAGEGLGERSHLVIIADQFEELYTLAPPEERQPFLNALIYAINHAPRFTLVLTLRADFYGYALSYRPFSDALQQGIYNLGPMNREELRRSVEKPAQKMKVVLEEGLTDTLIRDLGNESGRLPLLEFTLMQLWLKPRKWFLTHEAYQEIGGLEKALANHADTVVVVLSEVDRKRAEKIFIQLVCPGEGTEDTRRVATRKEVGEANWDLVQQLADARLLVTGCDETSENKEETVEIIHEALIREWGTFRQWIQDNREFRTWQERLRGAMQQWKISNDEGALLRGAALVEAKERLEERLDDLNQDEQDYIKQSIELRERLIKQENERRKQQLLAASITTIFFAGFAIFSGFQWRNSEINQIHALTESSEALLVSNQKLDALISSLHAGKKLNQPLLQIFSPTTTLKDKVKGTLQKVVYQVQEHNRLNGHKNVNSIEVSFSPDNQHLVTAGEHDTIKLWNLQGQQLLDWQKKLQIHSISISRDAQILATATGDGTVTLWNLKGQQLSTWDGNQGWIRSISFSPNGQLLATGGEKGARLWNLQGQQLAKLENDQGWVWSVGFSPKGQLLATGGSDGTTRLWNLQGQHLAKLTGHKDPVRSVSFSPNGQKLATSGDDGTVRLWNLQGRELNKWQGARRGLWFVSFSPNARLLATGGGSGTTRLWNLKGELLSEFSQHKGAIRSISFSLDGKRLATAGDDDTVYLWDLQGKHLSEFFHHQGQVRGVSFSPDGQRLATVGDDRTIRLWNLQGQESITIKGHLVSFSQDDRQIATAGDDGTVSLWDFQSKQLFKFTAHEGRVTGVSFSSDGQRLATVGDDGVIRLWNLQGQQLFQSPVLADANAHFERLSFSPDNRLLAAVAKNGSVSVWNLQGQKLVQSSVLEDPNAHFERLSFSLDSRLLAAVGNNGSVSVWDLQSGKNTILVGHPNGTNGVVFYSNSQRLATTGDDGSVRLWDLQGQQLFKFTAHQGLARSLSLSPNGQQLATTGDDGTVRLWNFQGQQLAEFPANSWNVIFTPDGQRLVTVGVDGTAKLWQIETFEELLKRGCDWVRDYLNNNSNVNESDRTLCNGIGTQKR